MEPVSPVIPGQEQPEVVYAKDQPQYRPLPSVKNAQGDVLTPAPANPAEGLAP